MPGAGAIKLPSLPVFFVAGNDLLFVIISCAVNKCANAKARLLIVPTVVIVEIY